MERFKTRLCKNFKKDGVCKVGLRCRFAHGEEELVQAPGEDSESSLSSTLERSANAEELLIACMAKKGMPVSDVCAALGKLCKFQVPGEKALAIDPRVQSLFAVAAHQPNELKKEQVVRLIHCAATLGATGEGVLIFVPLLVPIIPQLKAEGICGVAWALEHIAASRAGPHLEQLAEVAVPLIEDFPVQRLVTFLQVLFRNQIKCDGLLAAAGDRLANPTVAKELSPADLAVLALGFSELGMNHENLLKTVADAVIIGWRTRFTCQQLSDIAFAFWSLGCNNTNLMKKIGDITTFRLAKFSVQQLEKIQCAYGACGFDVPDEWLELCMKPAVVASF